MSRQLPKGARFRFGRIEMCAKYRGAREFERFLPETTNAELLEWKRLAIRRLEDLVDTRHEAGGAKTGGRMPSGTLERGIADFLPRIKGRASYQADCSHARAWLGAYGRNKQIPLGQLPRELITTEDLDLAIGEWLTPSREARPIRVIAYTATAERGQNAGRTRTIPSHTRKMPVTSGRAVAPNTIRQRCRVLDELYRTLDGAEANTSPVRGAKVPKKAKPNPVSVPTEIVINVALALAQTGDEKTYARYLVLNTTGQRPCQLKAARPDVDVDLKAQTWFVRTAKGAHSHTIHLNDDMIEAWRAFVAADAWGWFHSSDYGRKLHRAGWPEGVRPYNARHTLVMAAIRKAGLGSGQALAGHTNPNTTRTYYAGVLEEEGIRAAQAIAGRLTGVFGPRQVIDGGASGGAPTRDRQTPQAPALVAVAPPKGTPAHENRRPLRRPRPRKSAKTGAN